MTAEHPPHLQAVMGPDGMLRLPRLRGVPSGKIAVYEMSAVPNHCLVVEIEAFEDAMDPQSEKVTVGIGLRADVALKVAEQIFALAGRPIPQDAACEQCDGTQTQHESWCTRGR